MSAECVESTEISKCAKSSESAENSGGAESFECAGSAESAESAGSAENSGSAESVFCSGFGFVGTFCSELSVFVQLQAKLENAEVLELTVKQVENILQHQSHGRAH